VAQKQKIDEEVQIRRGQHPSSRRRPNRAAVGEEQGAEDADSHSSEARAAPEGEPVSEDMHSAHSFSNSDAAADDIPVGSRGRGAASGGRGNLGRRSRGRGSRLGGGGSAVWGGGRGRGRGGRNGSGGRGRGSHNAGGGGRGRHSNRVADAAPVELVASLAADGDLPSAQEGARDDGGEAVSPPSQVIVQPPARRKRRRQEADLQPSAPQQRARRARRPTAKVPQPVKPRRKPRKKLKRLYREVRTLHAMAWDYISTVIVTQACCDTCIAIDVA
jgi:hypothetical protein